MNLSKRLTAVCRMVTPGGAVCDVGCDHALTDIALISSGRSEFALASDVREGPLAGAARNIEAAGLSGKIKTVLADGVPPRVADLLPSDLPATLILTGMGGMLVTNILERAGGDLLAFDELVLSPQSDLGRVRNALGTFGFRIADEEMLKEDGKFYTLMRAVRGESRELSEEEALFGPVLISRAHPVLKEYLDFRLGILEGIEKQLSGGGRGPEDPRIQEVAAEKACIGRAMEEINRKGVGRNDSFL